MLYLKTTTYSLSCWFFLHGTLELSSDRGDCYFVPSLSITYTSATCLSSKHTWKLTLLVESISEIETFPPATAAVALAAAGLAWAVCELTAARSGAVKRRANVGLNEVLLLDLGGVCNITTFQPYIPLRSVSCIYLGENPVQQRIGMGLRTRGDGMNRHFWIRRRRFDGVLDQFVTLVLW